VSKVVCGDLFAGLLTCSGEVFTWGWNIFGQLGQKENIGVALNPTKVNFDSPDIKII
jgi:alpha-tubulin suppressor-like RCC1 family protein